MDELVSPPYISASNLFVALLNISIALQSITNTVAIAIWIVPTVAMSVLGQLNCLQASHIIIINVRGLSCFLTLLRKCPECMPHCYNCSCTHIFTVCTICTISISFPIFCRIPPLPHSPTIHQIEDVWREKNTTNHLLSSSRHILYFFRRRRHLLISASSTWKSIPSL